MYKRGNLKIDPFCLSSAAKSKFREISTKKIVDKSTINKIFPIGVHGDNNANRAFSTCNQNTPVWRENYQALVDETTRDNYLHFIQNSHINGQSFQVQQLSKCIK